MERARWLEKRREEILPVRYFHLVFTVPHQLNPLFLANPSELYQMLFHAAAQSLLEMARDAKRLGARIGFVAVLHTWGQRLELHPHIHCIVPGGGISPDGERWISSRPKFFLRVEPLADLFRGKFLDALKKAAEKQLPVFPRRFDPRREPARYQRLIAELRAIRWNVYSKPSFGGAEGGLDYLARYTHRVAIANHRLLEIEDDRVVFRWKDYRDGAKVKVTSLEGVEFIRRYLMHLLPAGFQRLRSYGLLANRHRSANLERCRQLLGVASPPISGGESESWSEEIERLTGVDPLTCPVCGEGRLVVLERVASRAERTERELRRCARAPP